MNKIRATHDGQVCEGICILMTHFSCKYFASYTFTTMAAPQAHVSPDRTLEPQLLHIYGKPAFDIEAISAPHGRRGATASFVTR